ncbi:MAG TPA: HAMP domain-containing sensor histidine kinase [Solirubrobacteraceae bacterium]|jgi:signal transduction histidine kinase|nr:HAMP domain-containing sensor histidine kinase [Solirubrobacteraceae bacterium]
MPARIRSLLPPRTIRLRLTLTYGIVFLLTGAALLTVGYLLVRHNLTSRPNIRAELKRLGLPATPAPPAPGFGSGQGAGQFGPGTFGREVFNAARAQVVSQTLHRLAIEYALALLAMTALSVAAGWLLAGRALGPLRAITATARRVSGLNLGERIALEGPPDELKELADTFDGMLERLDAAFASQRHFVANASHELRTPLAIMRTELDVALADPQATAADLRGMGEAMRETIDRNEGLIEALLTLAKSESVGGRADRVDLTELAAACVTDLTAQAHLGEVDLRTDLQPAATRGEPHLLERMIANLVENAIRHNVRGGYLEVITQTSGQTARVVVRNSGPPIDPDQAQLLVEPFRRLNRETAGFGLGLSIVRSVVDAHHGSLSVCAQSDGGLKITISLPAEPVGVGVNGAQKPRALTKS